MRRALLAACLLAAPAAWAWESACSTFTDNAGQPDALKAQGGTACSPSAGPAAARGRLIGAIDEHRQLWETARALAGLPAQVSATQTLTVFTDTSTVSINGADVPTLVPAALEAVARQQTRSFTPGELTQLPDFSYALWDWASGHETCPLAGASSIADCHDFASHMGPVNSNHFVPQSHDFYAHYHALALAKAADCAAMKAKLAASGGRFDAFLRACEVEALSLEAVGQHFLQDAWSMGHMWQRWGSSNLTDFPGATTEEKRDRAVLVALVSGFFHGARSVLQSLPAWTSYDVNDAMCAPWDDVRFKASDGTFSPGVGDNYLSLLPPNTTDTTYGVQSRTFFDCATSGMLAVYRAAGENHGAAQPGLGLLSVDPTSATCFAQRATNAALARGAAVNLKVAGVQVNLALDARFVAWIVPKVARSTGKVPVEKKLRNEFRFGLQRVVTQARLAAKDRPEGTDLADGQWVDFLGAKPNGQYTTPATYLDPVLPWTQAQPEAAHLLRAFHRANATAWCAALDGAGLQALKTHAADSTLDTEGTAAACAACTEWAVRHLRVGTATAWDTAQEPLCAALVTSPALVYHQVSGVTDPRAVAADWCCP